MRGMKSEHLSEFVSDGARHTVLNFKGSVGAPVNVSVITDGRDKSRSTSSFRIETLEIEKERETTA